MKGMTLLLLIVFGALYGAAAARGQLFSARLDGAEQQAMAETFQYAMENSRTNQAAAWNNPVSGNSGTLVPILTFRNSDRQSCREFIATLIVDGIERQQQGTACRELDGLWLIVPEESVDYRPGAGDRVIVYSYYPYGYVDWYSRYPYYLWADYYPGIFFSFNVVNYSRHHPFYRERIILNSRSFHEKPILHQRRHGGELHKVRKPQRLGDIHRHKQDRGPKRLRDERMIRAKRQIQGLEKRKSLVYGVTRQLRESGQLRSNRPHQERRRFEETRQLRGSTQFHGQRSHSGRRSMGGERFDEFRRFGGERRGGHGGR